jgi:hypothetical protein
VYGTISHLRNIVPYKSYLITFHLPIFLEPILSITPLTCKLLRILSIVLLDKDNSFEIDSAVEFGFSNNILITSSSECVKFKPTFKPTFCCSKTLSSNGIITLM